MTESTIGNSAGGGAVYVQTNDATTNEVVAFRAIADGTLAPLGRYATEGRGTGMPHLPSQSSIVLSDDGRWLLVATPAATTCPCSRSRTDGLRSPTASPSGGRCRRASRCTGDRLRR